MSRLVSTWLLGVVVGLGLAFVSVEISLIGMVLAVVALVGFGLAVRPRYAFLSGALIGIGGLWVGATVSTLPCEQSAAACGNPYPLIAIAGALVVIGVIAGVMTARGRIARHP